MFLFGKNKNEKVSGSRKAGSWKTTRLIAEGVFSKVYEAEKEEDGAVRRAVLKVVTLPADNRLLQSFQDELALMDELKGGSHIVRYGEHQIVKRGKGAGWEIRIEMDLLTPLTEHSKNPGFTAGDVIKVGIDICRALEVCREHHLIHRNIKPENIYFSGAGGYQLGDFSAAARDGDTGRAGTLAYMAPEVHKGGRYDHTVDIYSLGLTLYSLLNGGRMPFCPAAPASVTPADREKALARRFSGEPLPAPAHAKGRLAEIILQACAYDPAARFQSPESMREALETLFGSRLQSPGAQNMARYQQIADKMYPGIALFARDVNLPPAFAAKYVPGLIIKERAFVDASIRFMGMVTTHRYVILSNHMKNMSMFEQGTNWGLHLANMGSHFKVLGQYIHNGKTGIFLLHLPDDEDWKVYRNTEFDMDKKLYQTAVERFIMKADTPPVPELTTREWLDRCAFPLGMDDNGNLYAPDEITKLEADILHHNAAAGQIAAAKKPRPSSRPETDLLSRMQGCLLGGAVGDALGYPVEFLSEQAIFSKYGPEGIRTLEQACRPGYPAVISDDTQMTLFAANAFIYRANHPELWLNADTTWLAYREWLGTQGDTSRMDEGEPKMWIYRDSRLHALRAPGNTCLNAIRHSENGGTMEKPINNSKGCGTVMRAAPYGLWVEDDPQEPVQHFAVDLAARDAALTHGHPLAWGSSGWLAGCVFEASRESANDSRLEDCVRRVYVPEKLDPGGTLRSLIDKAVMLADRESVADLDAIHMLGEGWVAEEALAIAVFCAVRHQDDFAAAIRAAVNHKGDSDSTGAICGNILGTWLGKEAVEQAFDLEKLELRDVTETIARDLYRTHYKLPEPGEDAGWDERYRS